MPRFDTYATFQDLQAHGLSAEQATGITAALGAALDATGQALATTADLESTRLALQADLDTTRVALTADLATTRTALKADLDVQGATLRGEIQGLRVLMESRFQTIDARFTFTHWMIGLTFTVLLGFSLGNLWLLVNLLSRLPTP